MKNIFIIAIAFVAFSCNDVIEIEQVGRLGEEQAFETASDLESGILGVYDEFDYSSAIQFNSVFTDQVSIGADNGGQGLGNGEYGFRLNSASAFPAAWWTRYYRAFNAATRVIDAAALITPSEDEQATYNNALGEAYALRAWAYFELLTYFSADLTDDNSQGVIAIDFIPLVEDNLPRNTTGETFTLIEADLQRATSLIETESSVTFLSQDFLTALKARIALYRGDYTTADNLAASLLADYPLASRAEYPDVFTDDSNAEVIFKLERTIGDNYDGQGVTGSGFAGGWAGANFAFVNGTIDGSPYFEMSNSLFNTLNTGDIRYDVLVEPTSDIANNILVIGKYPGSEGQPLMNDLKVFRSSEMLFIRAEAAVAAGNLAAAAGFIETLRDARFATDQPTPSYANAEQAYADILNERRKELAYEGFRWLDLRRLGPLANISGITRAAQDCAINGACSLPISDIRLDVVPIPLVELDANNVIEQTDGY